MITYHKDIGLPNVSMPVGRFNLRKTRHARARENEKGFTIPGAIRFSQWQIIEIEMDKNRINKVVIRKRYDNKNDLVLVVLIGRQMIVKTAWLNDINDTHSTLNKERYGTP